MAVQRPWATRRTLMALRERMSSDGADNKGSVMDSGSRLEADCHDYMRQPPKMATSLTKEHPNHVHYAHYGHSVREELFRQGDFATLGKEIGESRNFVCNRADRSVQGYGSTGWI